MRDAQTMVAIVTALSVHLGVESRQVELPVIMYLDQSSLVLSLLFLVIPQIQQVFEWTAAQCCEQNVGKSHDPKTKSHDPKTKSHDPKNQVT